MEERKIKIKIGAIYLIISIAIFILATIAIVGKVFLYLGFSILGLSLRAFYFAYRAMSEKIDQRTQRNCYANYFIRYPLMSLALLSLAYLVFFDKFISFQIEKVFINPMVAFICLYVGFDIYKIGGKFISEEK